MNTTYYLACDLSRESGRIVLGTLAKGQLTLSEIHQFPSKTQKVNGHVCWDLAALEKEIFAGIEKAAQLNLPISGLSVHSWGIDYVLLDGEDKPLQPPVRGSYGHGDTDTTRLLKKMPLSAIYAETGIPLMPLHTLFQIEAGQQADPALFQKAERFLPIADYLNARLCGVAACEESLASTTQLYNPQTHAWSPKVLAALELPSSILPRLVPSGTAFGPVIDALRKHPSLVNTRVVATCSHDTAAATAAVPVRAEEQWAYLHSGLCSQFGVELRAPIMSDEAREAGFTNEVGLGGTIRFLKNSAGLSVVQECRRAWEAAGQTYSCDDLARLASEAGPAKSHLALDDPRFYEPGEMPEKIAAFCRETGQPVPATPGEIIRAILESLALGHAETLQQLQSLTGEEIKVLHVVGSGSNNEVLNQLISDTTGLPVIAGPADAAAIGNILIQALALWHLKSPDHLRSIVTSSFPTKVFKPGHGLAKAVREKFRSLGLALGVLEPVGS
ncbi:MAG TPA: rhamnulokinase family protein [Candidatus Methylacidiphilales bacterium]|nr:rhamnulokinase family protein [Candidatus Methylacidiphilales bacterium]